MPCSNRRAAAHLLDAIKQHSQKQDRSTDDVLIKRIDIFEIHRVLHDAHDEDAGDDEAHASDAAGERYAPQHAGAYDLEFQSVGAFGLTASHPAGQHNAGQGSDGPLHDEDEDFDGGDRNTGEPRRFLVAADGQRVSAKGRPLKKKAEKQKTTDADPDGRGELKDQAMVSVAYDGPGGVAQREEGLARDADRFSARKDKRQPLDDLVRRQRGDQGIDLALGNDDAVDQTDERTKSQY